MKQIKLTNEVNIPILGFGTFRLKGKECRSSVEKALGVGFRHIDTADHYQNHTEVADAIGASGIPRSEIFLTTKVWRTNLHKIDVNMDVERFLAELKTDYIDLLLVHWPNKEIPIQETLETMSEFQKAGKVRALGVSNFTISHLNEALKSGIEIVNNQVEFHPTLNQDDLKKFVDEHNIKLTAHSVTAQGHNLTDPGILEASSGEWDKTPLQVILNWLMAKGIIALTRSSNPKHIEEAFKATTFNLKLETLKKLELIGGHRRTVKPDYAEF